jgi:hypothetical protein
MVIEVLFGIYIILAGIELIKIKSARKSLEAFRINRRPSFIQNWFLFWKFQFGQTATKLLLKFIGDKGTTLFYRISGIFFLVASPIFFIAPFFQYRLLELL